MASPFKFFRKHQTELLVVIGILTMIAFIILPSILQQLDVVGRSRPTSTVVETQKYGYLSTDAVSRMKYRQSILANFFNGIVQANQVKYEVLYLSKDRSKIAEMYQAAANRMRALNLVSQVNDNSTPAIVMMWLLENKAQEMGLSINDSYISSFISEITRGLDEKTINLLVYGDDGSDKANKKTDSERAASERTLIEALNGFLLREKAIEILGSNWNTLTTGERFSSLCRINQRANVELYPVKVEDYVGKVGEPSDSEIKEFFEKYKDKSAVIGSSEPGLQQPQKIVLEYCYGSYEQFMNADAITDEEIQKNYDDNKENYVIEKEEDEKKESKLGEVPNIALTAPDGKQYRILDDNLKNEIRQSLAISNAKAALKEAVASVQEAMDNYNNEKEQYELQITDPDSKHADINEPVKPNLELLAKQKNLQYAKTDLFSRDSENKLIADYNKDSKKEPADAEADSKKESADAEPVSKRTVDLRNLVLKDVDALNNAQGQFFGNPSLYRGNVFIQYEDFGDKQNLPNEEFVIWKIQDVAKHVPTLEEDGIKDLVISQIKTIKARKLAEEEAKKLADTAINAQLPLEVCLGDAAFVPTQFPWMTIGSIMAQNRLLPNISLSPIEGVEDGGFDFMASLFQMKESEIKTIANDSQSVFYVVRMVDLSPKTEQLYQTFLNVDPNICRQVLNPDVQLFFRSVGDTLEKEAGLKWVIQPDQDSERD